MITTLNSTNFMDGHSHGQQAALFAPMLYLRNVSDAIEFYKTAFGATELRRWSNSDGSVHVAEIAIDSALFHLHEEVPGSGEYAPDVLGGTTVAIGLFVADPHEVVAKAVGAGALETSPVQDHDYDYRQGSITDPFGHHWLIEKRIPG